VNVDVLTEIDIARSREQVAAYAADPGNATAWYANIVSAQWKTPPPLAVGTQVAFTARFLGRRLEYTYEVVEYEPGRRLVMRTADGPFAMETTYTWADARDGSATHMTLRNSGSPSGFTSVLAPAMVSAMRRANRKDLERLRAILEADAR
jgi:Polyketide cyclase / dehydrase and lipid transport